jgi:glutathione S-transferase
MNLYLGFINDTLESRAYLLGDDFSAADIQMSFVGELACAGPRIRDYPNIDAWVHRFQERPAYKAAVERGGYYKFQRA